LRPIATATPLFCSQDCLKAEPFHCLSGADIHTFILAHPAHDHGAITAPLAPRRPLFAPPPPRAAPFLRHPVFPRRPRRGVIAGGAAAAPGPDRMIWVRQWRRRRRRRPAGDLDAGPGTHWNLNLKIKGTDLPFF
jgi:hypothetical protein